MVDGGTINNKVKDKDTKVGINGYQLFLRDGRKKKYDLFIWTEGVLVLPSSQDKHITSFGH